MEAPLDSQAAFDAFYRDHYRRVLNYVARRLSDPELASEICAETFVVAWRKFDPADPFPLVWLYSTARNLVGNAYRSRGKQQQLMDVLRNRAVLDESTDDFRMLSDALDELGEKDREALRLTYWEELTAAEVGVVLGCSEQAAWARISRAKASVRKVMERLVAGEGGAR